MLRRFQLQTQSEQFYNITDKAIQTLNESKVTSGICVIYCPHTTAGITINENADPDVVKDMLLGLSQAFPDRPEFRHMEGNSHAHLKASCLRSSASIPVENGHLMLGTWQGIYFCEFDGPRNRTFYIKIIEG